MVDDVAVVVYGTIPGLNDVSATAAPPVPVGEMALMDCKPPPSATAVCTNAVVATFVDESARAGVGAVGVPVNAGELIGAASVIPYPPSVVGLLPMFAQGTVPTTSVPFCQYHDQSGCWSARRWKSRFRGCAANVCR